MSPALLAEDFGIACRHLAEAIALLPKCADVEAHALQLERIEELRDRRDEAFNAYCNAQVRSAHD